MLSGRVVLGGEGRELAFAIESHSKLVSSDRENSVVDDIDTGGRLRSGHGYTSVRSGMVKVGRSFFI
jgi:hypothetical protein